MKKGNKKLLIQRTIMKEKVIISNPKEFEEKKKVFITAGAKQVRIVTDFDEHYQKHLIKEKNSHNNCTNKGRNYLSEDYTKKAFELHAKYYPIEMSTTIPLKEKKKQMMNWWGTHIKYLAKSGMNKKIVKDVAKNKIILRKNTLEFFEMIKKKKIPLLILSAALGDVIEEILKINKINYKGIHTISNFFEFDKKGNVLGYKGKIIHSLNKNEFEIKDTTFYKKIKDRKNILLLGDTLDDLQMVEGIKYNEIIKMIF